MSLRYSIYKVQTLFVSFISVRCELLYSSTFCRTCQELFPSFFKFFFVLVALPVNCSSRNLFSLPYSLRFVKNFFLVFRSFLISCCRPPDDLHILAHRAPTVKHFFTKYAISFWCFRRTSILLSLADSPLYSSNFLDY